VDASTGDARTADRARLAIRELDDCGLQVVLKHFPYLPVGANLHKESPDTRVPPEAAEKRYEVFRLLAGDADMIMTTHLRDTAVDQGIATFSTTWNRLLRDRTGFDGPVMSDGLLMLKNYVDRKVLAGGVPSSGFEKLDEAAGWAARALLAGHDMLIVEGSAAQTVRVFEGLLTAACGSRPPARELRARITESSARITRWKRDRARVLRHAVEVPSAAIEQVISLLPPDDADLTAFRFDPGRLARLEPSLVLTAIRK
jgi:beta-glucosidase-like glycosyl hydrolase